MIDGEEGALTEAAGSPGAPPVLPGGGGLASERFAEALSVAAFATGFTSYRNRRPAPVRAAVWVYSRVGFWPSSWRRPVQVRVW